ncbi:acyltransferase family protein [Sphingomonas nostoxanthinifaciens]|uniref:acyltransferase family protein n=1 Tax=Sphingomonas nostoxanthinifaciens TaxID=2872652 RepID=UPI001CC219DD|nr:acyltransferase [Sphingomonas nostoxanthinifaciens]UAK24426.1 acyltransferase [Sphingomonas nostoxanthinifaciens]
MIYNIQALRALAAFLVLFVHADSLIAPLGLHASDVRFGHVGVDLFFVISGFVMVHTCLRRPTTPGGFLLNRVIRVVPIYWILTFCIFGVALVAPSLVQATRAAPFDLVRSLLFIPFRKVNGLVQPVLFVGWTLNYEMFFYLLFAAALWLTRGALPRTVAAASGALLAIVLAGATVRPTDLFAAFYSDGIVLEFGFGMVIALLASREWLPGRVGGALIAALGTMLLLGNPFMVTMEPRWLFAGLPASAVLIGALALERSGLRAKQPLLQLLGAASYALYLTHPFVLRGIAKLAGGHGGPLLAAVLIPVAFLIAHLVAVALHWWLELPLGRRLRALTGHRPSVVTREEARAGVVPARNAQESGDKAHVTP